MQFYHDAKHLEEDMLAFLQWLDSPTVRAPVKTNDHELISAHFKVRDWNDGCTFLKKPRWIFSGVEIGGPPFMMSVFHFCWLPSASSVLQNWMLVLEVFSFFFFFLQLIQTAWWSRENNSQGWGFLENGMGLTGNMMGPGYHWNYEHCIHWIRHPGYTVRLAIKREAFWVEQATWTISLLLKMFLFLWHWFGGW